MQKIKTCLVPDNGYRFMGAGIKIILTVLLVGQH